MAAQRPTISDVAREAGVSKGAVSFALNGRDGVSTETRDRILAVAPGSGLAAEPSGAVVVGVPLVRVRFCAGASPPS